ncbi:chaplin [Streptomyces sp. VRA16 Mangrove soil]|uniref:chaplin n=1 Tax=Streptomyces sp. VRA16 Mangrove soil TaxID=2817434 RepID=UPI001A9D8036|nr:chaplin [Streptomyces sp. VRA16 Mangrove soil]MBO1336052.1 chaplin [Streptomyces sp. VRA16 Mangrove soil]
MKIRTAVVAAFLVAGGVLGSAGAAVAHDHGGAGAQGAAVGSPGVLSGNVIQVPVDLGLNACGNSINVIGLLNPAVGNTCVNG